MGSFQQFFHFCETVKVSGGLNQVNMMVKYKNDFISKKIACGPARCLGE